MIRLSVEFKLLAMLLFVSIASILAITLITYTGSEEALTNAVYNQLTSLRSSRKTQIEDLFKIVRLQASNLANFRTIIDMTAGLRKGYAELQASEIPPAWDQALSTYYRDSFLPTLEKVSGRKPILDAYLPREPAARYLQYWDETNNPNPAGQKDKLNDAGDGSSYSSVHRRYQAIITKYVLDFGYSNMLLADSKTGDVVYGFAKRSHPGHEPADRPVCGQQRRRIVQGAGAHQGSRRRRCRGFRPLRALRGLAGRPDRHAGV